MARDEIEPARREVNTDQARDLIVVGRGEMSVDAARYVEIDAPDISR